MNEKWRAVRGYESHYVVSNKYRARSLDRVVTDKRGQKRKLKGKILTPRNRSEVNGPHINLQMNGQANFVNLYEVVNESFEPHEIDSSVTLQQLVVGWPDTY